MAIWMARNELEQLIWDLSDAAIYGRSLVVFPKGKEQYLASDFAVAGSWQQAGDMALDIEFAVVRELAPLLGLLEKAFGSGFEEMPVLAEFEKMGLEVDIDKLGELGRNAYKNENLKKAIMDAKNLENLKAEMVKLGFGENLIGQMEAKMAANEPRFILYDETGKDRGRVEMALHFNQSRSSEYYYFNKFDLAKQAQPLLAPGEKYFVSSQRQGEEVILREFEMASLAVKEFNSRMDASKDIRGAAQLYAGASLQDSKELATMGDGKLINVDKDFYKTLKNPAPSQTFYIENGNGFTLAQGMNLLEGRSVYRGDMLDIAKKEYSAWVKLDFDGERDRGGNFRTKTFTENYGFDLTAVLDRFEFKELANPDWKAELEDCLRNGHRAVVNVDLDGKAVKLLAEAVPEFKQLNLYSLDGKSIKREQYQKQENIAQVGMTKDKEVRKDKEQQAGMSV